ncbi:SMP-30/gluconolactonase/LRE family protein [Nocardia concava]|uniref:SMP-30/gluconolactonase/LRE family protein n=1 Tax=Nocardia concava TaxID=257281 RepID=UPI00031B90EC|nr:SMP-30/gluconolactonase/LRE family protein [Nocardia concava]
MVRFAAAGAALGLAAGLLHAGTAAAEPGSCAPARSEVMSAAETPDIDWAEGLGYDAHGELWVTRVRRNEVQRYDATGRITARVAVPSPGAIKLGPDGRMYVTYGNSLSNLRPGSSGGGVVRIDPDAAEPTAEPFADGLGMANGLAFDARGELYVADTSAGIIHIRSDDTVDREWSSLAGNFGADGLVSDGDALYVTLYLSPTGRVLRVPIADPAHPTVVADLGDTIGFPSLPDDLASAGEGVFYDASTTGHLVRITSAAHTACTVLSGGGMTAVAVPPGSEHDLLVATTRGDLLRVYL